MEAGHPRRHGRRVRSGGWQRHHHAVVAGETRLAQGLVGALQQRGRRLARRVRREHAREARQRDVFSILIDEGAGGRLARLLQRVHGAILLRVREQHGEFVAAVARHQIVGAEFGEYLAGVAAQHRIARGPAVALVDRFEVVHVNDGHGEREAVALDAADLGLELPDESIALGQAGELVGHAVLARVAEFLAQGLARGVHRLEVIAGTRKLFDQRLTFLDQLVQALDQDLLEVVELAQRAVEILQGLAFVFHQLAELLVHRDALGHLFRQIVAQHLDVFLMRRRRFLRRDYFHHGWHSGHDWRRDNFHDRFRRYFDYRRRSNRWSGRHGNWLHHGFRFGHRFRLDNRFRRRLDRRYRRVRDKP